MKHWNYWSDNDDILGKVDNDVLRNTAGQMKN